MATQQSFWVAADGMLFNTEADADAHDAKQAIMTDLTKLDQFWTGKSPQEVIEWLMANYDLTKKGQADLPGRAESKP
jgi:hypothetical protein